MSTERIGYLREQTEQVGSRLSDGQVIWLGVIVAILLAGLALAFWDSRKVSKKWYTDKKGVSGAWTAYYKIRK